MAITTCKKCGNKLSDKAEACPHCGYLIPPPFSPYISDTVAISIAFITVFIVVVISVLIHMP